MSRQLLIGVISQKLVSIYQGLLLSFLESNRNDDGCLSDVIEASYKDLIYTDTLTKIQ